MPLREIKKTPAFYDLSYEDIYLSVESPKEQEERIHGWWIPAQIPTDKTLLYLHGGGHNNSAAVGGEDYLRSIREFEEFVSQKS